MCLYQQALLGALIMMVALQTVHHKTSKASIRWRLVQFKRRGTKIPPRDCVASAPFDKGVNRAVAASPRNSVKKR